MNGAENLNSQEMSFLDIFDMYRYSILVPAIQRDYAQGRSTAKATKIRKDFVEELKRYLMDGNSHSLDFIYGKGEQDCFIPLDGQQRLTTLWLLHLYLACMTRRTDFISKLVFNYETRDSSFRFCKKLLENADRLLVPESLELRHKSGTKYKPSEVIMDEDWWFTIWLDDPTIQGMLTMLDEIDRQFYDTEQKSYACVPEAGNRLFGGGVNPIVFQFMSVKEFHDIDDLYIKMNARGLSLTSFEIFKSKLIEDFEKVFDREVQNRFKSDIDVAWSDTLWKYRKPGAKNIDEFLQRALVVLIANNGPLTSSAKKFKNDNLDCLFEANGKQLVFAHNWYEKQGVVFDKDLLVRLMSDLSVLLDADSNLLAEDALIVGYDTHWFDIVQGVRRWILMDDDMSYDTRLKLHAYLKFKGKFPDAPVNGLLDWMKLLHNLVEATPIDDSEDMVKALSSVESILTAYQAACVGGFLTWDQWLASPGNFLIRFFASYQWEEEIVKAKLRLRDAAWKGPIEQAEMHPYLDGQIGITLYLADVYADFENSYALSEVSAADYAACLNRVLPLFTYIGDAGSEVVKQFAMVKAMLAKGRYMLRATSWRQNFCNRPGDRDYSWKRLFRVDADRERPAFKCLRYVVEDPLFDMSCPDVALASLLAIGQTYRGNDRLKQYLLGPCGTALLKCLKQGFVAYDKQNVLLYHMSRRNHYHSELETRVLYEELKRHYAAQIESGKVCVKYISVKSGDDDCHAIFNGYTVTHWIVGDGTPSWMVEWTERIEPDREVTHTLHFENKEDVLGCITAGV